MSLLSFQNVDFSVGGPLLLEQVTLSIEPNERVCIVGRNGAGKSTLLRLMAGEAKPDDGEIRTFGSRIAGLSQEVPKALAGTVFDVVAMGLGDLGADLARYHHLLHDGDEIDMDALGAVQARIEAGNGWQIEQRVEQVISKLDLPEDAEFAALSGGMKRRVLLAQALVAAPDLLLLDEPTNHLDIESIAWLEEFLKNFAGSVVFVTHDRASCAAWPPASSKSIAARSPAGPATTRTTCAAARNACTPRRRRTRCSTRSWRRRKCGSARASRPGARATKAA